MSDHAANQELVKRDITITTRNGFRLAATHFAAQKKKQTEHHTVVIASALRVPRYIYFKLAYFFAEHGFSVLTFDYRGIHDSQNQQYANAEMNLSDWGRYDIDAVLNWTIKNEDSNQLLYFGYSCGGQILGLAPHAHHIHKAVFVASQSGYWKLWPKPQRWAIRIFWHLISLLTAGLINFQLVL